MSDTWHIKYQDGEFLLVKDDWKEKVESTDEARFKNWHGFTWLNPDQKLQATVFSSAEANHLIRSFWPDTEKPPVTVVAA
jgi:hypothetical protein